MNRRTNVVVSLALASALGASPKDKAPAVLGTSKPVIVRKIHGYASFEEMPEAKFTVDDKLTVYYEPTGYTIETTKEGFRALLKEDGRLRKKGSKDVIWKKENMFEYEAVNKIPPYQIYLKTDIGLKGLPAGDYELDLTLRDGLAKESSLTRTVGFTIVATPEAVDPKEKGKEKAVPADPPEEKARAVSFSLWRSKPPSLPPPRHGYPHNLESASLRMSPTFSKEDFYTYLSC